VTDCNFNIVRCPCNGLCSWSVTLISTLTLHYITFSVLLVLIHNIGHRMLPKIWVGTFLVQIVHLRRKTALILTLKMETRHPVDGQFGREFPAICNHCVLMTAWSRKTWKFCEQFLGFFGKTTPYGKIFIIPFLKFTSRQRSTLLWWNVLKFVRQEIWEIVHYLPYNNKKQNFGSLSPKIFQGQPPTFGLQSHCY